MVVGCDKSTHVMLPNEPQHRVALVGPVLWWESKGFC
jgi:hypothetical protein